ncbi:MAG TPA: RNA polymerase factor sigma-54 [Bacteroidia bacterium]|jgi:RNA polymerase sigma-54 factor|nr:RNA polymerase factor sigma-54 [Bacteroidia bacterium]
MLKQSLSHKLLQKLSPQQIQLMKMLQLPTVALEQRIKEELEANPALEEGREDEEDELTPQDESEVQEDTDTEKEGPEEKEDELRLDEGEDEKPAASENEVDMDDYFEEDEVPDYKLSANNTSPDEERREIPVVAGAGFQDLLLSQLGMQEMDERRHAIAEYLIGNLDDDGYLRRELTSIVDDIAFSQNIQTTDKELLELLHTIQQFDPPGIGARDLQECLFLQLKRKPQTFVVEQAIRIVRDMMEEFSRKHYDKMARKLDVDEEILKEIIQEIVHLNPRPGDSIVDTKGTNLQITPDFIIHVVDDQLELSLNAANAPDLRISKDYNRMLDDYASRKDRTSKEALSFVKQKVETARWFIDAIRQRQETLLYTMNAIMEYQYDYFLDGDETKLRPMILKDIADRVGMDISTISRVANSKYVQTPFGTFLLKTFFSESLSTDSGEEVSSREVKKILSDCISAESKKKPLTDDKLCQILKDKGYNIARRTVAKYREQLEIPVARMRKEL